MKIVITGRIPSKKNSKQIIKVKGKPRIISSNAHKLWHSVAMLQIGSDRGAMIKRCSVQIDIYFPDKRKADLTNKAESLMDLIVDAGVIEDDNWKCVNELHLLAWYDKENPRAEIKINRE